MQVKREQLEDLVLEIIARMNLREDGRVTLDSLADAWKEYGLRASDLADALEKLLDEQVLIHDTRFRDVMVFDLTPEAVSRASKRNSLLGTVLGRQARLKKKAIRRRKTEGAAQWHGEERRHRA